jgi:hypothetical protein
MAVDCDWIFVNKNRTWEQLTLQESTLPCPGDGKSYGGRGYKIEVVGTDFVSRSNPLIIAVELPARLRTE